MFKQFCMALALGLAASSAAAAPLTYFEDDFSGYSNSTVLNAPDSLFNGNWVTTNGTVDYIAAGETGYGPNSQFLCPSVPGDPAVACVDLDGSSNNPGVFSTGHTFAAGYYSVLFAIAGNNRLGTDTVTVTFGNIVQQITLAFNQVTFSGAAQFGGIFDNILVTSPTQLSFSNDGSDNIGMLLKYVRIEKVAPVPVPAAGGLLVVGLMGLAALRRRSQRA